MTQSHKIAGIGELLWDVLPAGKQMGGAPCNFAFHAGQAGFDSYVISAVGTDRDGKELLQVLDQLNLNKSFIQTSPEYATGTVTVKLDVSGMPEYTIHKNVAWDHIVWNDRLEALAKDVDAVCFGSLAQRSPVSKNTIWKFLETTKPECLKVFDINLRQSFYNSDLIIKSLEIANVLKLNEDELPVVASFLGYKGDEDSILAQLLEDQEPRLIALTKGSMGSILLSKDERSFYESPVVDVADTVGAGDSFTAILLSGMLNGWPLAKTHSVASEIAAFVCTRNGATPEISPELINTLLK